MRWVLLLVACSFSLPAATFYVTVAGLGGEPDYEQRFNDWARELDKLVKTGNVNARAVTLRGEAATREAIRSTFEKIAQQASFSDDLMVTLIGHGSFDGEDYKFNLPGPDLTAVELASLLDKVPASRQLVVNATSSSGASVGPLQKENRAVISATKSGTERNATVFARYWVEALRNGAADTDKNGAISALEAFRYAEQKTSGFYETQKRLATEHAVLEDTGEGEGVRAPAPENGKGRFAATFAVVRLGAMQEAANDPATRSLLTRKEELEQQIDKLKYEKAAMPTAEYRTKMTELLLQLARTQAELDKK